MLCMVSHVGRGRERKSMVEAEGLGALQIFSSPIHEIFDALQSCCVERESLSGIYLYIGISLNTVFT